VTTPPSPAEGTEPHLFDLVAIAARRWRWTVALPTVVLTAAVGFALVIPSRYTARTTVIAESRTPKGLPAGLAGLAGTLGLNLDLGQAQSPKLYAEVAKSRGLVTALLRDSFPDRDASDRPTPLIELLGIRGRSSADSVARGVKWLTPRIDAQVEQQTSIVAISVTLRDPGLAAAVTSRIVDHLNRFNTEQRQSQARERRRFVEGRVEAAQGSLADAEGALRAFYERNRNWQQSYGLTFEEGRLRRDVDTRQEVILTLTREYETARIEEVNDTPVLTVIDPAVAPRDRSFPRLGLFGGVALVAGLLFGVVGALLAETLDRARQGDPARHGAMRLALADARADLRAVFARRTR
jgi:uncharacterized protein involved in exopolysaccharide biosynthesis